MIAHRDDPKVAAFFRMAFEKRPAEEFYDLGEDPDQLRNVAALPEYAEHKRSVVALFEAEFGASYDPEALGIPLRPASKRNS
jgi:N-sulfoglucosamine sulfohydrolase